MIGLSLWLLGLAVGIGVGSTALIPDGWALGIQIAALVLGTGVAIIGITIKFRDLR